MMEALIGAMQHTAKLHSGHEQLHAFSSLLQKSIHAQMVTQGTRDLHGKDGLTTERFVERVAERLQNKGALAQASAPAAKPTAGK